MRIARILNVVALGALVGAAALAYQIKYDATLHAEEVAKLKRAIAREQEAVTVLKAELARLTRPDRIQALADRHLDLVAFSPDRQVQPAALPPRQAPVDLIALKLEALGLGGPDSIVTGQVPAKAPVKKR